MRCSIYWNLMVLFFFQAYSQVTFDDNGEETIARDHGEDHGVCGTGCSLHGTDETDTIYNCTICTNHKVKIEHQMLKTPLKLLSDLSVICDVDVYVRAHYSLSYPFPWSCYFGLTNYLLKFMREVSFYYPFKHRSKIMIDVPSTMADIEEVERFLGTFLFEYLLYPGSSSVGFDGLTAQAWRPNIGLFIVPNAKFTIYQGLPEFLQMITSAWGDKGLWLEATIFVGLEICTQNSQETLRQYLATGISLRCLEFPDPTLPGSRFKSVELLNRMVYQAYQANTEYYYILQTDSVFSCYWILRDIAMLRDSQNGPQLGIVFNRDHTDGYIHSSIAFHRHHMDIMTKSSAHSLPLLDPFMSMDVNFEIYYQAYRVYDSVYCIHLPMLNTMLTYGSVYGIIAHYRNATAECSNDYVPISVTSDGQYVKRVNAIKQRINTWLCHIYHKWNTTVTDTDMDTTNTKDSRDSQQQTRMESEITAQSGDNRLLSVPEMNKMSSSNAIKVPMAINVIGPKVAVITAIFGGYEKSCKPFTRQLVPTDFIAFTDDPDLFANGWILDVTPYYQLEFHNVSSTIASIQGINAWSNNQHPFNIAKYYKTHFHTIPRLQGYDVVIWVDGTISIKNMYTSDYMYDLVVKQNHNFAVFENQRYGSIEAEVVSSLTTGRYDTTTLHGRPQPYQDIKQQYQDYLSIAGDAILPKSSSFWGHSMYPTREHYGSFVTCFFAVNMHNPQSTLFLEEWFRHIVMYTTQDQISFPFVAQQLGIHPYPLPEENENTMIKGDFNINTLFVKTNHGL